MASGFTSKPVSHMAQTIATRNGFSGFLNSSSSSRLFILSVAPVGPAHLHRHAVAQQPIFVFVGLHQCLGGIQCQQRIHGLFHRQLGYTRVQAHQCCAQVAFERSFGLVAATQQAMGPNAFVVERHHTVPAHAGQQLGGRLLQICLRCSGGGSCLGHAGASVREHALQAHEDFLHDYVRGALNQGGPARGPVQ